MTIPGPKALILGVALGAAMATNLRSPHLRGHSVGAIEAANSVLLGRIERDHNDAKVKFETGNFYNAFDFSDYPYTEKVRAAERAALEQKDKAFRNGLIQSKKGDTLRRALPFLGKDAICWHGVDIRPIESSASIETHGVQRIRLPTALKDTVSAALNQYKRMADTWLVPPASATEDQLDEMKQRFTQIYKRAESQVVKAANVATSAFLSADNMDDRIDAAWAFKAGPSTMRLMLGPSQFVPALLRIAGSPQFSDVPTPVTGKVLTAFVAAAKDENLQGSEIDVTSVDVVHIDASRGGFFAGQGAQMLGESLALINTQRDEEELMKDYLTGMLDLTNFWMSPRHDAKPMCFMRHSQGADGNPTYSGSTCKPSCSRCQYEPKPELHVDGGHAACNGIGYNHNQDWMYFPDLSLEQGWAAAFPTATSCHSAFDGDWSDPHIEQRCSCELRALSLVIDMDDQKSVNRAAALLATIPSGEDEARLAFQSGHPEAVEFLERKWAEVRRA